MIIGIRGHGESNPEGFHKDPWRIPEDSLRSPQGAFEHLFKAPLVVERFCAP